MRGKNPWPRSLLASCIVHCLVLAALGWAGAFAFGPAAAEQFIELALVDDAAPREPVVITAAEARVPVAAPPGKAAGVAGNGSPAPEAATATAGGEKSVTAAFGPAGGAASPGAATSLPGTAGNTGGRLVPPRVLQKVEPAYPEELRRQGATGTVVLRIEVLESGRAANVTVLRSSGFAALDEAALQAIRQWRFVPAKDEATGTTIRCYTALPVVFRLN